MFEPSLNYKLSTITINTFICSVLLTLAVKFCRLIEKEEKKGVGRWREVEREGKKRRDREKRE